MKGGLETKGRKWEGNRECWAGASSDGGVLQQQMDKDLGASVSVVGASGAAE